MSLVEDIGTNEGKPFWKSKRVFVAAFTAAVPYLPYIGPFAAAYPEAFSGILAAVFGWVGLATVEPIKMSPGVKKILRV